MSFKSIADRIGTRRSGEVERDQLRGKLGEILVGRAYGGEPDFSVFKGHDSDDMIIGGMRIGVKTIPANGNLYMNLPGDSKYAGQDFHCCVRLSDDMSHGEVSSLVPDEVFRRRAVLFRAGSMFRDVMARLRNPAMPMPTEAPQKSRSRNTHLLEDNLVMLFEDMDRLGTATIRRDQGITSEFLDEIGF